MHDFIGLFDANSVDLSQAHKLSEFSQIVSSIDIKMKCEVM